MYAPVGGQIVAVNTELGDNPSLIADSPFDKGWMIRISGWSPEELKGMLSAEAYRQMIESGGSSH